MSLKVHTRSTQEQATFYLDFLKTKQEEIITELQKEIQKLRSENSELKFQLFVGCPEIGPRAVRKPSPILKTSSSNTESESNQSNVFATAISVQNPSEPAVGISEKETFQEAQEAAKNDQILLINNKNVEIKRLELELTSARKIIEELKWVQVHYENRMQVQELKLDELQREIIELKSTELEIFQLQIPPVKCDSSRSSNASSSAKISAAPTPRRRRSSSASRSQFDERRSSLQSILPDNYKDSVATLPPISSPQGDDNYTANECAYRAIIKNPHLHHSPCTTTIKLMATPRFPTTNHHHHRLRVGANSPGSPSTTLLPMKTPALVESSANKKNF